MSTVLPLPDPAKIAVCLRSASSGMRTSALVLSSVPISICSRRGVAAGACDTSGSMSAWSSSTTLASGSTSRNNAISCAGLRASSHDVRAGEFSDRRAPRACSERRSSSLSGTSTPPARCSAATVCSVFAPLGHGALRMRINRRRGMSMWRPAAVTARSIRARAARALVEETARKHQCSSSSVSLSTVWRSRACNAGRPLGGGSCARLSSDDWCSWIQASRPAESSAGTRLSSVPGSSGVETSAALRNCAYRSSSASSSDRLAVGSDGVSDPPPLEAKSVSSVATPVSRQWRMCLSTAMSSWRGVKSGALSNASTATGHVGCGVAKPTSRKHASRRRSSSRRPTSDDGIGLSRCVTRNRSRIGATPRAAIRSHALDSADNTEAVRGNVSRRVIRPWASCSTTLSSCSSA
ncbi:hypothetical protein QE397_000466 [Rhodococcus sp. SORGH_AS 301]|nr:hypothetical protein [Rhodococcus sp. SORGH_AS_0301]